MTKLENGFQYLQRCPICGASSFSRGAVLWDTLVNEWELTGEQRRYIDDQQGLCCDSCKSNLRSMTLAYAILSTLGLPGLFSDCCAHDSNLRKKHVLEINEAGSLTPYLNLLPNHLLISFPEYDMQQLKFPDARFDLVVHSDTLEHIPNSLQAIRECRRVLVFGGLLAYTIPIIPERLTRSRVGLSPSYHGQESTHQDDFLVHREYGSDFWSEILEAGFKNFRVYSIMYPASLAIVAMA
jgi:SAM-dependent methyltransferase